MINTFRNILAFSLATVLLMGLPLMDDTGLQAQSRKKKKRDKQESTQKGKDKSRIDYLFIEANTQYLQGNAMEAIVLFKQVLDIDSKHHASMYNISKISFEEGDFETAAKYARMALDANPENYWYYAQLVAAHQGQRNTSKAIAVQEQMVEKFPEDKDGLFELAQLYIEAKQYQKSVNAYESLEKLIGMNEDVVFRKHQLYLYLNQPDNALAEIEKLIAFFPNDQRYYQAKYDIYLLTDREEEAQKILHDLLEVNPNDAFALLALADYYKSKQQYEKSDEYLYRAFGNPAVDLEAKVKILSGMYSYAKVDDKVLTRMKDLGNILYKTHPESAMVNGIRGDIFQVSGDADSARVYYLKSLESEPANEQVWQELLFIDSESSDFISMKDDSERALEYFPNQALFLYFFGLGSSQSGDNDEAIYAFEKIKKIGKGNDELLFQACLSLGEIYHKEDEFGKSDENFEAALEIDSENPLILNNYAYFLSLRNEQLERAEKMVLKALEKYPKSSAYQDTYGWILYLQGKYETAEEWIGKAVEGGGGAEVLEHYGDVWMKLGDYEKAKGYWEKAKDAGADHVDIAEKMKSAGN